MNSIPEYFSRNKSTIILGVVILVICYMFYVTIYNSDSFDNLGLFNLIGDSNVYQHDKVVYDNICDTSCNKSNNEFASQQSWQNPVLLTQDSISKADLSFNNCQSGGLCPNSYITSYAKPGVDTRQLRSSGQNF